MKTRLRRWYYTRNFKQKQIRLCAKRGAIFITNKALATSLQVLRIAKANRKQHNKIPCSPKYV